MSTDPRSLLETRGPYKAGFVTDIESESVPPGLNEEVVRLISEKKSEPEWLLDWRLGRVPIDVEKPSRGSEREREKRVWLSFRG